MTVCRGLELERCRPRIDFLFLELRVSFSLSQDSAPVSEKHELTDSNTVDGGF